MFLFDRPLVVDRGVSSIVVQVLRGMGNRLLGPVGLEGPELLRTATKEGWVVLTHNRLLHARAREEGIAHGGIVYVCKADLSAESVGTMFKRAAAARMDLRGSFFLSLRAPAIRERIRHPAGSYPVLRSIGS